MEKFNHINPSVPYNVQTKMREFAGYALENFINDFKEVILPCEDVNTISGIESSGYIPYQSGGFEVYSYYPNDCDSTYHFTRQQTDYVTGVMDQLRSDFFQECGLSEDACFDDLTEEQKEDLFQFELEYFSEDYALLSLEVFAVTPCDFGFFDPGVHVNLAINYKDAPYYRRRFAETLASLYFTFDEFLAADIEKITKRLKNF